jgi:hypothetical protein
LHIKTQARLEGDDRLTIGRLYVGSGELVPIRVRDETIKTGARVTKETKRHFEGEGAILLPNGRVAVEGRGRYLKMSIDSITDIDFEELQWMLIPDKDDPEMLELPRRWECSRE